MTNVNGHVNGHANGRNGFINPTAYRERELPQSVAAEKQMLGAILMDGSAFAEVRAIVRPGDLYFPNHEMIYAAMLRVADAGVPVEGIAVMEELERRGQASVVGGLEALGELVAATPHAVNAAFHAGIVAEKARRRRAIRESLALVERLYGTAEETDAVLADVQAQTARLRDEGGKRREPVRVADLGDIRRVAGESRWLWEGWLMDQHMTVLAAEPGVGKTRLACDIIRRMWHALQWPDGQLASRPPGTSSLWVASDRNHAELLQIARDFDLPDEAIRFNAQPEDPFGCLKLDNPQDLADLRARVEIARPGIIVIDTINKATRRLLYRPEEAEAFFGPLLDVALATATPILALTHLSKGGDPLDRRIEGFCRVMWKMERPDPEGQPHRRLLKVSKSNSLYPAPHGVSMGSDGNQYDLDPPKAPEWKARETVTGDGAATDKGGRPPKALAAAMDWLREKLADGPIYCAKLIDDANKAGHAKKTFNRALNALKVVKGGPEGTQFYRLPVEGEEPDPIDEGE